MLNPIIHLIALLADLNANNPGADPDWNLGQCLLYTDKVTGSLSMYISQKQHQLLKDAWAGLFAVLCKLGFCL